MNGFLKMYIKMYIKNSLHENKKRTVLEKKRKISIELFKILHRPIE